jgi:hypothetical protein
MRTFQDFQFGSDQSSPKVHHSHSHARLNRRSRVNADAIIGDREFEIGAATAQ